jgi:hydrogenase expression/formation protein HypE
VQVVTGDTKVVEKGSADGLFINTSGIGVLPAGINLSANQARPGDRVIISGSIGDHGIAVMAQREGLEFETTIESDSAPLHGLVASMLDDTTGIRCMRDPTRGGVASTCNEIAAQSAVGIELLEGNLPIREEVQGACELLGLDPLYVANEGKLIAIVDPGIAEQLVLRMQKHHFGRDARIIGTVTSENPGLLTMRTNVGTTRVVDMLTGDQLPRIC